MQENKSKSSKKFKSPIRRIECTSLKTGPESDKLCNLTTCDLGDLDVSFGLSLLKILSIDFEWNFNHQIYGRQNESF
jgi:hypothetical protein